VSFRADAVRRGPGPADRGLLAVGAATLLGVVVVLAIAVAHHLRAPGSPVLPISWARSGGDAQLSRVVGRKWLTAWQFDAVATAAAVAVAALYLAAVAGVARRRRHWPVWRTLSFLAGLGICLLAVSSAVGVYDMALFSTHMIGHLMLVMIAPPFLVAGRPLVLALHAVGNPWHNRFKRILRGPVLSLWFSPPVALATYAIAIVGTHLTGLMNVIMMQPWAGQLEHLVYVVVGYQFFTVAFGDEPLRWSLTPLTKLVLLGLAMGVDTFTGVVLFESNQPLAMQGLAGGVDPLGQTILGGAIMWAGGDGIMALLMMLVVVQWLRQPGLRRRAARGWLVQARNATLAAHSLRPPEAEAHRPEARRAPVVDVDEDEQALTAYNAWLHGLAQRKPEY
jgi:cytochrome c oxidase assembly factor CtaG